MQSNFTLAGPSRKKTTTHNQTAAMTDKNKISSMLRPAKNFIKFRILHIDDSPHRIALAVALGIFVAYMPIVGLHILLMIAITCFIKVNRFVAITSVWFSNPLTFALIYYPNYLLGRAILSLLKAPVSANSYQAAELIHQTLSPGYVVRNFHTSQFWQQIGQFLAQAGLEMFIGGLVIGAIAASAAYAATLHLVIWYRKKHPHRHLTGPKTE